jgi:hypothetical protein
MITEIDQDCTIEGKPNLNVSLLVPAKSKNNSTLLVVACLYNYTIVNFQPS